MSLFTNQCFGKTAAMNDARNLPSRYKYFEMGPGKYRANLLNESDAKQWMEEYVSLTNTNWVIFKAKSNTPHYICSLEYNCHRTSYRRVEPNKNAKGKSKNCSCSAKLKIAIKHTTKDTRKKDKHVKEGMPAVIAITNNHSHSLTSAESLSYLRPTRKVRDEFDTYFDSGFGITESIQYHESKLELKYGVGSVELANASINPKYRTVSFWYHKWRTVNLGPRHGEGVLETKADKRLKAIKAPAHSLQHQQQVVTTVNRANKFTIAKLVNGATSTSQASSLQASTSSTHALPISEGDIKIEIEEEKLFDPSSREYIEYPNTAKRARIEDDTTNVPTICSVKQEIEDATEDQDLVEAIEVKKEPGDDEPDVADYLSVAQIKMEIGEDFVG